MPGSDEGHEEHPHDNDRGNAVGQEAAQFKRNYLLLGIIIHDV
jgi:hypothetical protein